MNAQKTLIVCFIVALLLKLFLFTFAEIKAPNAKIMPDTHRYLESGVTLLRTGTFARETDDGSLAIETFRTPGYPLFLGFFKEALKIPLRGIVFIQIIFTLISALIVYLCSSQIDKKIAKISTVIILFDIPITIFSLLLLSETLFMILLTIFMYTFVIYLHDKKISILIISGLLLSAATYTRPITYYFGFILAAFVFFATLRENIKKAIIHALLLLICVYGILGLWQLRNFKHTGRNFFSHMEYATLRYWGLYRSYERNTDPETKNLPPFAYYVNTTSRCFLSLMTRPGTFKYFVSKPLKISGKIIGYPWMVFWMIGFVAGLTKLKGNIYIQFLTVFAIYMISTSIFGAMWIVSSRFRVPIMPFIAVISAYGWQYLYSSYYKFIKR